MKQEKDGKLILNKNKMKRFFKNFIWSISLFVITVILCVTVYNNIDYHIDVPGTVIAKNTEIETRYKSKTITDVYRIAVRPDDPKYNVYDVKVSFGTYATISKGQHVCFEIANPEIGNFEIILEFLMILSIALFIGTLIFESCYAEF